MPKISQSSQDVLQLVLETAGESLDGRLRKILEAQTDAGRQRARRAVPPLPDGAAVTVHRVKVSLHGARPPVWRRLEIPSGMGLDLVHEALQTAFGWYDCHHHRFETACGQFGDPVQSDESWRDDESRVALAQVAGEARAKVGYVYDFGSDWRHDLVVEAIAPAEPGIRYPRCTGGRGAAPEENSGGIAVFNEGRGPAADRRAVTVDTGELTSALAGLSSVLVETH